MSLSPPTDGIWEKERDEKKKEKKKTSRIRVWIFIPSLEQSMITLCGRFNKTIFPFRGRSERPPLASGASEGSAAWQKLLG